MRIASGLSAVLLIAASAASLMAQQRPPHPAETLGLLDTIPWATDGANFFDRGTTEKADRDAGEVLDEAIAQAKGRGNLVLWYVHRIQEKGLRGNQMYRAPVLDVYMQQVLFADPDVAALTTENFVPVRCVMTEPLCERFGLRPLEFVEPAVVFLDGDGKVVHHVERFRTFHAQWFADLLVRVLDRFDADRPAADDATTLRRQGRWRKALAAALADPDKTPATWLQIAELQRLLRMSDEALDSLTKAEFGAQAAIEAQLAQGQGDGGRRGRPRPDAALAALLTDVRCERGLLLSQAGMPLDAQPFLEQAYRAGGSRSVEAGYWHALNSLLLGDEVEAMRRFSILARRGGDDVFGKRARANAELGPDDRPVGAAFTGFERLRYLPPSAYEGLPKDTTWNGPPMQPRALARQAVEFLLSQQRDDGGFTDARYAYWPSSEITPNVWVAITAISLAALWEFREVFPEFRERIDLALARGEAFAFDPKRLNRGANEDCYSDAYRLMYLSRRTRGADPELRRQLLDRMNVIVQEAAGRQRSTGFWAHEYENAFCTGAVLQELLSAQSCGAAVPTEVTDKAAGALLSARFATGSYSYGGSTGGRENGTPLKDSAGRMPVCEGTLLQLGRSDFDKVRFALDNFWEYMKNLEGVRRNDFHSDGELGGFFFFHALFHTSEVVRLLPEEEQEAHWRRFVAVLADIPEMDGSFLDSHELGRSYGTAMALLTLRNAARFE